MPEIRADTHVGLRMKRQHFCSILNEAEVCQRNFSANHRYQISWYFVHWFSKLLHSDRQTMRRE